MNHGDIKLVIDQLHGMELDPDTDEVIIFNTVNLLETLDNKVAQQAAVIEKLQAGLLKMTTNSFPTVQAVFSLAHELIAIPTDSKQILKDWMRDQLGEPVAEVDEDDDTKWADILPNSDVKVADKLFKLPECLK